MSINNSAEYQNNQETLQQFLYSSQIQKLNLKSDYIISKMESAETIASTARSNSMNVRFLEENVNVTRSIEMPVPVTSPSHPRMAEKKYWKMSFRIVFLPFIIFGIPAHLPLMKRPIKSRNEWLKSLIGFNNLGLSLLTILLLLISIALNVYVLRNIVEMFITLVIKGNVDIRIMFNLTDLVQNLPIIITTNFIWIWGYHVRDLILSFTRPSISESFLQNPDLFHGSQSKLPGRVKLVGMLLLIVFIHTFHIYMYSTRLTKDPAENDTLSILTHFGNYFIGPVFSTLILPVYSTFCWACHRHYAVLSNYIQTLINMRAFPEIIHFNRFKLAFKELSDRIQMVNNLFSIYLSWVIINIVISLYVEAMDLAMLFMISMSKSTETDPLFPPDVIRGTVAFLFFIFLKFVLILFTVKQAVDVNDEARYLNVWLNDLVTEPNASLSVSNYHAFRLLKFYIRSRMQQPLPALLRLPIICCIPAIKQRLSPPLIDQY